MCWQEHFLMTRGISTSFVFYSEAFFPGILDGFSNELYKNPKQFSYWILTRFGIFWGYEIISALTSSKKLFSRS